MAWKITTALLDDIDGGPAEQTIHFALDGVSYEIDLNWQHTTAFRAQLAPFIEHARTGSPASSRPATVRPVASRHSGVAIRAWARQHGIAIHQRGRIPASVIEQYQSAADGARRP